MDPGVLGVISVLAVFVPVSFGIVLCSKGTDAKKAQSPRNPSPGFPGQLPGTSPSASPSPSPLNVPDPKNLDATQRETASQIAQQTGTLQTASKPLNEKRILTSKTATGFSTESKESRSKESRENVKKSKEEDSFDKHAPEQKEVARAKEIREREPVSRHRDDYKTFNEKDMPPSDFDGSIPEAKTN
ncbi:hypothetical protein QR680_008535 [Steinernema hermaphroditum]|uniref:Uncharacterized protein n=1 Tax=Steinernema hermaphroditum TaxID=289476 RepID=A0AA39IIC3_9BILA|nr:hypothetical protein QR680_008535 [Steinernema hermaphroditum]